MREKGGTGLDALVLDGRYAMALAVVRSLGRAGLDVAVAESPRHARHGVIAFASRYCAQRLDMPDADQDPEGFGRWLGTVAAGRVVIPVALGTVRWFARHRPLWRERVQALVPEPDSLELAADKARLHLHAAALGLPVPQQFTLADAPPFPVIVKYREGEALGLPPDKRYAIVGDRTELERAYRAFDARQPSPVIQEYLAGPGYGCSAVCDRDGRPLGHFVHQRLREYPVRGGPSALAVSVAHAPLAAWSLRLLESLHWVGPAMVEWKQDGHGGFRLLEINPRFWGTLPLAIAAGADFPLMLYRSLVAEPQPPAGYASGVRLRFLLRDFLAARADGVSLPGYLRELRTRPAHEAIYARDDPRPFAQYLGRQLRKLGRQDGTGVQG